MTSKRTLGAACGLGLGMIVMLGVLTLPSGDRGEPVALGARRDASPMVARGADGGLPTEVTIPAEALQLARVDTAVPGTRSVSFAEGDFQIEQVKDDETSYTVSVVFGDASKAYVVNPVEGTAPLIVGIRDETYDPASGSQHVTQRRWTLMDGSGNGLTSAFYVDANGTTFEPDDLSSGVLVLGDEFGNQIAVTFFSAGTYMVRLEVLRQGAGGVWELIDYDTETAGHQDVTINVSTAESPNPCSFKVQDMIGDHNGMGLLPSNDWVPLFSFTMSYTKEKPALRVLESLCFSLHRDPKWDERGWDTSGPPPDEEDLRVFGLFQDRSSIGDPDNILNLSHDGYWDYDGEYHAEPFLVWDRRGAPYDVSGSNDADYTLDFLNDFDDRYDDATWGAAYVPYADDVVTPHLTRRWVTSSLEPHRAYIVAVRLSPSWSNRQTLGYTVWDARMLTMSWDYRPGYFPWGKDGPLDTYSPNFYKAEYFTPETGYAASFGVYDLSGSLGGGVKTPNIWSWPNKMYTPAQEHVRPRWDVLGSAVDLVTGEWMDIRQLFSLEDWTAPIGIDVHGRSGAGLVDINVIFTDIGGDPYGTKGNGGLNPITDLERFTSESHGGTNLDYAFNGCWVYGDDGSHNGAFDSPGQSGTSISFADYPMVPAGSISPGNVWEYIPFPPGGGDPWWKVNLSFTGAARGGYCAGGLTEVPDGGAMDYFVVFRPDSGYADSQALPGDGTGMSLGVDFRVFLEPRRYDASSGTYVGGLWFSNMVPPNTGSWVGHNPYLDTEDSNPDEPWWSERTLNANNAKPLRGGFEVHDLVLTYNTNSDFYKRTPTNCGVGGPLHRLLWNDNTYYDSSVDVHDKRGYPPTGFDAWLDPFGILSQHFFDGWSVWVVGDASAGFGYGDDTRTSIQYAFETVPFFNAQHEEPL